MLQNTRVSSEVSKTNAISDLDITHFVRSYLFPTGFERLRYVPSNLWFYKELDGFYAEFFGEKEWAGLMCYFSTRLVSLKSGNELRDVQACVKIILEKNDTQKSVEKFVVSEHKLINSISSRENMFFSGTDVQDVNATLLRGDLPESAEKKRSKIVLDRMELSRSFIYQDQKKVRKLVVADYHTLKNYVYTVKNLLRIKIGKNEKLKSLAKWAVETVDTENFIKTEKLIEDLNTYGEAKVGISYDYFSKIGDVFTTVFKPTSKSMRKITVGIRKRMGTKTTFLGMPEKKELMLVKTMEFLVEELLDDMYKVVSLGRELEFYLNSVRYANKLSSIGISTTFPVFQEGDKKTVIEGLYNPLLFITNSYSNVVDRVKPVANNVEFTKSGCVMVLTGPNNTGKSVYAKSVGIATVLAQNGLPIPAKKAHVPEYDNVLTHFISTGSIERGEGMFVEELRRIKELFCMAHPNSLIIIDEPVKGSSFEDAEAIALRVLVGLRALGAHTCLTTHLHNVASEVDDWDGVINMRTEIKDGKSTHRVVRGQEKSLGVSVADEFGLTEKSILEMVQKNKKKKGV